MGLPDAAAPLADRVDAVIEDMIVFGDILEMREQSSDALGLTDAFSLWPAPPSFVTRENSSIAILGIAGELISPLTAELEARVRHSGVLRIIDEPVDAAVPSLLEEMGLY